MVCCCNGPDHAVLQEDQENFWSFGLEKPLGVQSLISYNGHLDYIAGSNMRAKWLSLEFFG